MKLRGLTQSIETSELTAEADDAGSARALIEAQVPEGYELVQVHNSMPRGGRVIAKGLVRASAIEEIEAEGSDYFTAREALKAAVPEGRRLVTIVVAQDA
ncbi:hypothetical protein [Leifsonia sp. AG29]|uniref:hypothetical protein n=1 Tax=Leifsonia sp. AG29 TaxID=2598860 RepID=UPI00131AD614|nr:hypothetical protein [Leifsonia sp. AG29]